MKYAFVPPSLPRLSQLDTAPSAVYPSEELVELEGLVSVRGQSGWGGRHPDHDIHSFTLSAWRRVGGAVMKRDLLVLRAVLPHDDRFSLVKPGDFLRLSVLLDQGEHRSLLASVETLETLKNEGWLDEDEAPLTEADFLSRLTLRALTVDEFGHFTFWYDDGDVFWGHAIEAHGTLADGVRGADISG